MKLQLENIWSDANSSFKLLHNPKLNDLFYWHFHPEYELVYIDGANGTRHVGKHISTFKKNDLVLIGSNIPHLNFDYGIKTEYEKEVLQVSTSFKDFILGKAPELHGIWTLFEQSHHGIVFSGKTKNIVGNRMKRLYWLSPFEQFVEVLHIFEILSKSKEYELLHNAPILTRVDKKGQERLQKVYSYIDAHYDRKISIAEIAALCNLGKEAFCRYFKKASGSTFTVFLNQYRVTRAKRLLLSGKNVGETCYACGFESLSYFNRTFKGISGENPSEFKRRILSRKAQP
ncbi:MAG: AraC family transcriptional regulator [Bacteroidota bacterium]